MQRTLSLIALAIACCFGSANAQIIEIGHTDGRLTELATLRTAGKKFASPRLGAPFNIYNLDFSVHTTITPPTFAPPFLPSFMWNITEDLFDTDPSTIEYLAAFADTSTSQFGPWVNGVAVYRQDGTELFFCYPGTVTAIVNTPGGVLMLVDTAANMSQSASVLYQLPGVMPCEDCFGNLNVGMPANDQFTLPGGNVLAFPNPTDNAARINYDLPAGTKRAQLVLHAMNGQEVQRISLTGQAGQIVLTTQILPAGTYIYHIVAEGLTLVGDQLVVVH